ncbi:MAG: hypothetical protein LBE70_02855 [Nitrososphaerota archaeon]|jgi:hypothetical protein|nr:hypothetical protein [Nitrososphaerota archaeon]
MTNLFSDNFELGNLNSWTSQNQPTPPVLTLSQLWRTSGTSSLRFKNETNNTHVFQLQKTINNQQKVCLSAHVMFTSLDFPAINNQFTLFSATTTSSELPLINLAGNKTQFR